MEAGESYVRNEQHVAAPTCHRHVSRSMLVNSASTNVDVDNDIDTDGTMYKGQHHSLLSPHRSRYLGPGQCCHLTCELR